MTPETSFAAPHQIVRVELATPTRGYDILVGQQILAEAGSLLRDRIGKRRCIIVTDNIIAELYLKRVEAVLTSAGHNVLPSIIVPAGESSKSFPVLGDLMNLLFDRGIDRQTILIALGGGVIGDLTGFAAAIALRGVNFIQIPTTLLAQVDSSVGGKTGIDSLYGKNTIGAFHQPLLVLTDVSTLDSLPPRELLAGYGEIVKYGLIMDPDFFTWCEAHAGELLHGDTDRRTHAICKSCALKAQIVIEDERESGKRALLNLGHTFGHALESVTGYGNKLLHGEAVAIGSLMAFMLSSKLGLCTESDVRTIRDHFVKCGLPTQPPTMNYDIDELMTLMAHDKKAKEGTLTLVLAHGIGKCFVADTVDPAAVRALWQKMVG